MAARPHPQLLKSEDARSRATRPKRATGLTVAELEKELTRCKVQAEATQRELWKWHDKIDALEKRLARRGIGGA